MAAAPPGSRAAHGPVVAHAVPLPNPHQALDDELHRRLLAPPVSTMDRGQLEQLSLSSARASAAQIGAVPNGKLTGCYKTQNKALTLVFWPSGCPCVLCSVCFVSWFPLLCWPACWYRCTESSNAFWSGKYEHHLVVVSPDASDLSCYGTGCANKPCCVLSRPHSRAP